MKRLYFILLLSGILSTALKAQLVPQFTHYSTEDGLPQYTIMNMLQDKKGLMWFATWDGISKYDGFSFRNYKIGPEDNYSIKSNRVQRLYEDKNNRIWFESYDGEIHCLNPRTEKFWGTQLIEEVKNFRYTRIVITETGKVWLLSDNHGAILVRDSIFNHQIFSLENGALNSNYIYSVFEDKKGNSWILTDNGITRYDAKLKDSQSFFFSINGNENHERKAFFSALELENEIIFGSQNGQLWKYSKPDGKFGMQQTSVSADFTNIIAINPRELILLCRNQGFLLYNHQSLQTIHFQMLNQPVMRSDDITNSFTDNSGNWWFETGSQVGIYRFDTEKRQLSYYRVEIEDAGALLMPPISYVFSDIHGNVWVQPRGGGFSKFNKSTGQLEPFYNHPRSSDRRFSNIIHSAYSDRQGNLWMCTRSHGLEKVVFSKNFFRTMPVNKVIKNENTNDVRAVFEDENQQLWVATKDKRISIFDRNKQLTGRLNATGNIVTDALWPGMVYCIFKDSKGIVWVGTKGEGLFRLSPSEKKSSFKVERYSYSANDKYSLSDNNIYSIFEDKNGNIWTGTYGGGLNLLETNQNGNVRFINHRNKLKNYPLREAARIRFINQSPGGAIYVGTTGGLIAFKSDFRDPGDIEFKLFTRLPGKSQSLSNNDVHSICRTARGEVFLATFGGGLNKIVKTDKAGFPLEFSAYTTQHGLPSDVILSIVEDEQGKLWISNENNLSKFDPETERFETYADIKGLMQVTNFSEASTLRLHSNEIVFGFSDGIVSFFPGQIVNSNYRPNIVFTGFQLFNIKQPIGDNSPLKSHIDDTEELVLTHKQNFFSIEFASLDFTNPANIMFAYKLEGFDNEWNYVQKQRIANYTNLPHGHYTFRVKSTNGEGVWVENERTLNIRVKPSFWQTPWATALYVLLTGALIFSIVRTLLTFYTLRNNMKLEKQISEMKLRFFTDISHEIRTPLTMITAPVDYMINDAGTPEPIRKQLQLIAQNTGRLLRLVNQILDFRKIQFMNLKVFETDIAALVEDICGNFTEIAASRKINFKFVNQAEHERVWVDHDCIDKMLMNLLSNAFKFTPEGRLIQVSVFGDEKTVSLQVRDEGPGIPKDKQRKLFNRFVSFNADKSKPSTGIGLSMVKDLADKHGARINIDSEEGHGTTITVSFMRGTAHFSKGVEIIASGSPGENKQPEYACQDSEVNQTETTEPGKLKDEKHSVLIVEDDHDLRTFIKTILENDYQVLEAEDGLQGKELALKEIPDFIVSDIMMPHMDGIELLQELKTNLNTSHIPVVLLTSKTTIESKLEGLAYGADDYITKPFSVSYFRARIANLLSQRKHLQEIFRSHPATSNPGHYEPQPFTITSQDEVLMTKVMSVIEANMENFEFTVDDIREQAGMSRSAFFKKIKSLTGLAPVEFIRDIKMKRAAQLLSSGEYRVKEVTFMIGFSDSKYFAKCFKEKFGVTPMEYKQTK